MAESTLNKFSDELAKAAEQAGRSVVTVRARMRVPSSGIVWRKGVIVTANHTIRRESEISVLLPDGKHAEAKLAGRDPGTDLALLKVESGEAPVAKFGDTSALKLANFVIALGRTRSGNLVASGGIVGGLAGGQLATALATQKRALSIVFAVVVATVGVYVVVRGIMNLIG